MSEDNTWDLDDWDINQIKHIEDYKKICWDDVSVCQKYPQFKWVYDKYKICNHFGTKTYSNTDFKGENYPYILKPRFNLLGMGKNSFLSFSTTDTKQKLHKLHLNKHNMIAQEYLCGLHISTDLLVKSGEILQKVSFIGHSNEYGLFDYWQSTINHPSIVDDISKTIGWTGGMNVETIGNKVIEVHLRPAIQFADINCELTDRIPYLNRNITYNPTLKYWMDNPPKKCVPGYSKTYWRKKDAKISFIRPDLPPIDMFPGVTSYNFTWYPGKWLSNEVNPLNGYRYLIINGTNYENILKFGKALNSCLVFEEENGNSNISK